MTVAKRYFRGFAYFASFVWNCHIEITSFENYMCYERAIASIGQWGLFSSEAILFEEGNEEVALTLSVGDMSKNTALSGGAIAAGIVVGCVVCVMVSFVLIKKNMSTSLSSVNATKAATAYHNSDQSSAEATIQPFLKITAHVRGVHIESLMTFDLIASWGASAVD